MSNSKLLSKISLGVVVATCLMSATTASAATCGGPYYITSVTTVTSNERAPVGVNSFGMLSIGAIDAAGVTKYWSSSGYAGLFPANQTDLERAKSSQVQAMLQIAILAYKTGASIYPTVTGTTCTASTIVNGRTWLTGLNSIWMQEEPK